MKAFTAAACALSIGALAACSRDLDFERMRQQPRVDPYSASTADSGGRAMRVPPAGTVAFERDADVPTTGRHDFETHCSVCHGADGRGQTVMAANMPGKPMPSLVDGDALRRTDAELLDVVARGKDRMPPSDWALSQKARAAVVAYVRMLQQSKTDGVSQ